MEKQGMKAFGMLLMATLFASQISFAQVADKGGQVTVVGVFNPKEAKSGYEINGYYVELSQAQADSLKGKKVSVTGRLVVVKGITSSTQQGAADDRKFIREAKITFVKP